MAIDGASLAQAAEALAHNVGKIDQGRYWQYFNQVAQHYGMTAGQLARQMSTMVGSSGAARTALQGLNYVRSAGLLTGMAQAEVTAITGAITAAETASVGATTVAATAAASTAAPAAGGFGAWFGGLGVLGQAAVVLGGVAIAGVIVYGAATVIGNASGDDPVGQAVDQDGNPVEARTEQERADDLAADTEAAGGTLVDDQGYAVVEVTNHPRRALAVLNADLVDDHQLNAGDPTKEFYLCYFLHGGNCEDYCVTTPNGNEVCGENIRAELSVIGVHAGTSEGLEEAWRELCSRFTTVNPAPLAEGWVGDAGDEFGVTIDWTNFIFTARPCVFDS